jgi:hypothetical protein
VDFGSALRMLTELARRLRAAPAMSDTLLHSENAFAQKQHRHLELRADDWVEVRSREEILATLDDHGRLDGMPFMPEMLPYCGRTLRVFKRAHKTCDTIYQSGGRSLERTVHLAEARCDGSAHGGCEAACLLFWNEAWLKPASARPTAQSSTPSVQPAARSGCTGCTSPQLMAATQVGTDPEHGVQYACQATELLRASKPLSPWNPRQYMDDYRSGNTDVTTFLRGALYRVSALVVRRGERLGQRLGMGQAIAKPLIASYDMLQRVLPQGVPYPRRSGSIPKGHKTPQLSVEPIRPGSWVRVKSYEEILATLDTENKNRGLYFDAEHVPYCGKELRVRSLVSQILDERTGFMLRFKTPGIILEAAYCLGTFSDKRLFCPRAIYPYWRAVWLTPLEEARSEAPPELAAKGRVA